MAETLARSATPPPAQSDGASAAARLDRWIGDPSFMLSLAKGLLVLHAVASAGGRLSIGEIMKITGLSRPTTRRCVHTLQLLGYVVADEAGVAASARLATLASACLSSSSLIQHCRSVVEALRDQTGESTTLFIFHDVEALYVAGADGARRSKFDLRFGYRRQPLYCTSIGRVLLAFQPPTVIDDYLANTDLQPQTAHTVTSPEQLRAILAEIRSQDFTIGDQEAEIGLRSVTAAVRDARGQVVAALNIGVHAAAIGMRELKSRILPRLREASAELTKIMAEGRSHDEAVRSPLLFRESSAQELNQWVGDPSFMLSLARGLFVLEVAASGGSLSTSQIAATVRLSRATTRRCVYTLEALGYLRMDAPRAITGPRLVSLAMAYISASPLVSGTQWILQRLREKVKHTTSLWAFDDQEAVYVSHVEEDGPFRLALSVGARAPLYCTSIGRVYLASLADADVQKYLSRATLEPFTKHTMTAPAEIFEAVRSTRKHGYALVDHETEVGLRSVSVPIRNRQGKVIAAVAVNAEFASLKVQELRSSVLPAMREAASEISALIP